MVKRYTTAMNFQITPSVAWAMRDYANRMGITLRELLETAVLDKISHKTKKKRRPKN